MKTKNNYALQAQSARSRFLGYDQKALIRKFRLEADSNYLYFSFISQPHRIHRACLSLGGKPFPGCDIGYTIALFDGLEVAVQFWHGDEEFAPRLRYLWDENATMYIRYETMHYAIPLLLNRLLEQ